MCLISVSLLLLYNLFQLPFSTFTASFSIFVTFSCILLLLEYVKIDNSFCYQILVEVYQFLIIFIFIILSMFVCLMICIIIILCVSDATVKTQFVTDFTGIIVRADVYFSVVSLAFQSSIHIVLKRGIVIFGVF